MTIQKTEQEWRELLAAKNAEPVAYDVTRKAATERPFTGKYEGHWASGIYRCICCDALLFESGTKFDAGCGWPSWSQEIGEGKGEGRVERITDTSHGMGYVGTPAMGMSRLNAEKFCEFLSKQTGRTYRLSANLNF